jgi:hypothetical protein
MTALRKILIWFFTLEAAVFVALSLLVIWMVTKAALAPGGAATSLSDKIQAATLLVGTLLLGPFYVAVWWKAWRRALGGRAWALAGSLVNIILGLTPPLLSRLPVEVQAHASSDPLNWGLAVWGLLGLIAFWDRAVWYRESMGQTEGAHDS